MRKTINQQWVSRMAEELICEILQRMSEITLTSIPADPQYLRTEAMDAVLGQTIGDYQMQMQFRAPAVLFERLARQMIGEEQVSQQEVEEYAREFLNIVCGRFISELYMVTGCSARFLPTVYERPPDVTALNAVDRVNTIYFISDNSEAAVFSWLLSSSDSLIK